MTNQTRLRRLGATSPPRARRNQYKDYRDALWLTNTTGLAELRHYQRTLGACAREHQEWLCAITPFLSALGRHTHDVGGLVTVGTHPPGQPLPEDMQEELRHLEEVVMATGTQVLEMRDSDDPEAADFSITGRLNCATWYLALGDREGNAVRRRVWEHRGTTWRQASYVAELAAAHGLTPAQYEDFRGPLSDRLPPADHPEVLRRMRDRTAGVSSKTSKGRQISYADMADLLTTAGEGAPAWSDPVTSCQASRKNAAAD